MKTVRRLSFFILIVVAWQLIASAGIWPDYLVPTFKQVMVTLYHGLTDGSIIKGIWASFIRLFWGYGLSIAIGIPLGFLLGKYKYLEETVGSLVLGLQTLPSITWLPLAIIWFGLNEMAIVFVIIMGSLLSITISTLGGVKNFQPIYSQAAQTMGAKGFRLNYYVVFPGILPSIVHGLKLGWSFAWRSLMAGELIFSTVGLGQLLNIGRELNDMSQVMAIMIVIVVIGLVFDNLIFNRLENALRNRWGLKAAN